MTTPRAEYCYECAAPAPVIDGWPTCPEHGPRWRLRRNAPCADVAIERDGRVLLQRRGREPEVGKWEWPGGYQDLGESPATTVLREAREELDIAVRLTGVLGVYLDPWWGEVVQVTTFVGETDDEPRPATDEVTEWGWFAADALPPAAEIAFGYSARLADWATGRRGPLLPGLGA